MRIDNKIIKFKIYQENWHRCRDATVFLIDVRNYSLDKKKKKNSKHFAAKPCEEKKKKRNSI